VLYAIGLGLLSMTPPDFSTARWLVSIACGWIGLAGLIWVLRTPDLFLMRAVGGLALGIIVFLVWPGTIRYISGRETVLKPSVIAAPLAPPKPDWWRLPIPNPSDRLWPLYIAKKHAVETPNELTLHDLYMLDFAAAGGATFQSYDVLNDPKGHPVNIEKTVRLDMDRGSRSVAFYLPYWDDTSGVASFMVKRVKPFLDMWAQFVVTTKPTGDADVLSSKDVPFSNRVYFYSEKELTAEQTGDLTKLYRENGLQFLPRSQSYLSVQKLEFETKQRSVSP
jgi:hypothetical protein